VGPRHGLDGCGKFARTGSRYPDPAARSESLYRLSYLLHLIVVVTLLCAAAISAVAYVETEMSIYLGVTQCLFGIAVAVA
jgi:hypothetical protein